jgi:anti-sigma factor ChrR (cupin superfamily)
MSSASGEHGQDNSELVFLYALEALPPSEMTVVEAHLSACAECRQEMETLRPIIDAFAAWPTDVLRPPASASLWERLAQRIGAEPGGTPVLPAPPQWAEPEWKEVAPGISCKLLATDREKNRVSMLVRLAPGTDYPPHRHVGVEELYMLQGELIVDDERFSPGDYRRGEAGAVDHRIWSETGCTCVLLTSFHDVILPGSPPQGA